ncbi:MAG: hypothetical protein ACD_81C00106G0003 [uncultured bacterium]|uniref:TIGR04255 family protein n=1 Tax=Candidatus Wolfebacteria bacterium GW2011_GWE2_44_13 TaxID=1619017 RepID=A0A0G1H845_9BACT|nr:MAG: hypothetical protein ACD_81C00106G0003 [uncultured bacterium]KKT43571.1 MAG: hypothetical protein UW32_C0001G0163 [Candidatus Wolfebacteria bacterium GW2011_GWE2_44_13]
MEQVKYLKSPIREAIFDVRLKFSKQPEMSVFEEIYEQIKLEYPTKQLITRRSVSLEVSGEESPKVNSGQEPWGVRFISQDGTKVAQFRLDGFTFSKLKPYDSWESFFEEAEKIFDAYLREYKPDYIERIALRYINAIEIPESSFEIEEYFATSPKISISIPQTLRQFFLRVVIQDDASESIGIINQTIEGSDRQNQTTIVFDIDVFEENTRIEPRTNSFKDKVLALKEFRTRIFEGSLTEKTKSLFK